MKQLFKKSLLAATVAATCGAANAGTVSVAQQVHSEEGLAGVTASQQSADITYTLGAAYKEGDKLTLSLPTGTLDKTNPTNGFPTSVIMEPVNSDVEDDSIAGLTWGLLNAKVDSDVDGVAFDQVTYRVTALTNPTNVAGTTTWGHGDTQGGVVGGGSDKLFISYSPQALLTAPITVAVSSETQSGDELDNTGTRTATVAQAKSQFGALTVGTKFDGVIDVTSARLQFVSGTTDMMAYTVANPVTTGWLNLATVTSAKASVYGEAGKQTGVKAANWSSANGAVTYTEDAAKVEIAYTSAVTNDMVTFTASAAKDGVALESQDFTTDFTYNYTSAASVAGVQPVATGADSGEWTLNGATVNIPYMPYSPTASQIIYVTNAGSLAGDITATAFDDKGNMYELGKIGTANAKTVTKVTNGLWTALQGEGFTGGKLSITITVNAAAEDVTVYASYNAGSVRGFVNTDQYKGK